MQKHWHYTQPGDQVDIIAPSYGCPAEMVTKAKNFIERLGLTPHIPETLLGEDPFCAHNDTERFNVLQQALVNPRSNIIWCIRGGYGAARLIPSIAAMPIPSKVKLLIGFSDITALHLLFQQHFGWPTLHAEVLSRLCSKAEGDEAVAILRRILFGQQKEQVFSSLAPLNTHAKQQGVIHATVTGGNLSLIQTSIGTSWQMECGGKIVLIEEIDERGYRIDRMLEHIKQSALLDGAKAVLVGDIIGGEEQDGRTLGNIAIKRFAESLPIPVLECKGVGHGAINHPLPFGTKATLILGDAAALSCQSGGR